MSKPVVIEIIAKDGASKVIRAVANDLDVLDAAGERAHQGLGKTSDGLEKTGGAASGAEGKLAKLAGGLEKVSGAFALVGTAQQVLNWTDQGTAIEGLADSYHKLTANAKVNGDTLLASMRSASNGYISDIDLMKGANKALLTGGEELAGALPKLLQIAGASARATGGDMSQLYQDLIEGITKAEPEILDNLGITLNLTQVYDDYAQKLGKTANELTTTEKSAALLNAVMAQGDGFIQKLGGSTAQVGGSVARLRSEFANLKTELQGLSAIGLEQVLSGGQYLIDESNRMILEAGKDYATYRQIMTDTGQAADMLTEAQYRLAQSLMTNGSSAADANQKVQSLADTESVLRDALTRRAESAQLSEEQINALVERTLALAAANPEVAATLYEASDAIDGSSDAVQNYIAILDEQAAALQYADIENARLEQSTRLVEQAHADAQAQLEANWGALLNAADGAFILGDAALYATDAGYAMSDSQYENANANLQQQLAAAQAEMQNLILADVMAQVEAGSYNTAEASGVLAAQLNIEQGEALNLINAYIKLNAVRGQINARKTTNAASSALQDVVRAVKNPEPVRAPRSGGARRSGGGARGDSKRSGSGSSGKSEAVKEAEREERELEKVKERLNKASDKANKQREKLERDHAKKLSDIWDEWRAKELAATEKFNADKFQDRLSMAKALVDVDEDLWNKAKAEESAYWDEAQKIAQAGDAQKADEFYKAAKDYTAMKADHAQELRDLDEQIAAEEDAVERQKLEQKKRRLQEIYAEEEKLAAENLDKIRTRQEEIDKQRDEALAEENEDYTKAQADLAQAFAENVKEVVDSSGKIADAVAGMADRLVADFDRISSAAAASGGSGGGEGGDAPPPDGSHALGLKGAGVPHDGYIAELHKQEWILTKDEVDAIQQGKVLTANGVVSPDRLAPRSTPLMPSVPRGDAPRSTGGTIVIAPNFGNSTAPRAEVRSAAKDIETIVRKVFDEEARKSKRLARLGG